MLNRSNLDVKNGAKFKQHVCAHIYCKTEQEKKNRGCFFFLIVWGSVDKQGTRIQVDMEKVDFDDMGPFVFFKGKNDLFDKLIKTFLFQQSLFFAQNK